MKGPWPSWADREADDNARRRARAVEAALFIARHNGGFVTAALAEVLADEVDRLRAELTHLRNPKGT